MKILVTGATGFIGAHVVKKLVEDQHEVLVAVRSQQKVLSYSWFSEVRFVPFNLKDKLPENIYEVFQRPEVLIHLAWEGLPHYRSSFHVEENYPRHREFLQRMIEGGLPSLTVTGTCLEYGMRTGCLSEDMEPAPHVPYAQAKIALLKDLFKLQERRPFSLKWVRLFYIYGPGQNENSILSQLDRALERGEKVFNMSGGEQLRDYLPVEKVAYNIVKLALQPKANGVINCCSGEPISIKQFVNDYLVLKGKRMNLNLGYYPYPDYEAMAFWGDTHKLKEALNG